MKKIPILFLFLIISFVLLTGESTRSNAELADLSKSHYQKNEQGQPHGEFKVINSQGDIGIEGYFSNGKKEGVWIFWDSPEKKLLELEFKNDLLNGSCRMWWGSFFEGGKWAGNKKVEMEFENNVLNGTRKFYYPEGGVGLVTQFKGGQIISAEGWNIKGNKYTQKDAMLQAKSDLEADLEYISIMKQVILDYL